MLYHKFAKCIGIVLIVSGAPAWPGAVYATVSAHTICATVVTGYADELENAAKAQIDPQLAADAVGFGILAGMRRNGNERTLTVQQVETLSNAIIEPFFGPSAASTPMQHKRKQLRENCMKAMHKAKLFR